MSKVWQVVSRNRFLGGIVLLVSGTVAGQIVLLLVSPLLTRLYTPEHFGLLAVYSAVLSIVAVVCCLRYELAIPLAEDGDTALSLVALCMVGLMGTTLATALGVWAMGPTLARWTQTPSLTGYLWWLPLSLLGVGCYQILNLWAVRNAAYRDLAHTKLSQSLGQVVTQLILGVVAGGPTGLILGQVVGQTLGSRRLFKTVVSADSNFSRFFGLSGLGAVAYRYRRFPILSSGSAVINVVGLQLSPLVILAAFGSSPAGWYALGQRVVALPMAFVGQAVAQVYLGEAARLRTEAPREIYALFWKMARRLFLVGLVPFMILAVAGDYLFFLSFGPQWQTAGLYVKYLAVAFFAQFVVVPLSQTLNILGRQDLQLLWDVCRLFLVVASWSIAVKANWSALASIGLHGLVQLGSYAFLFGLCLRELRSLQSAAGR